MCAIGGGANEGKRKESCKSRVLKKTVEKKGEGVVDYSYYYFNFLHKEQSSLNRG